jgi:hypothetical protein
LQDTAETKVAAAAALKPAYPLQELAAHKEGFCQELRTHGFATIRMPEEKREMVRWPVSE